MMMLTLPTAKSVGVTNRSGPCKQSVQGGVEYLRQDREPSTRFNHATRKRSGSALASYNVGYDTDGRTPLNQSARRRS
ncbi:hypothetical protein OK016_13140 [Vibrio chagasii]|nr:hypothetical protein [Vibrio chagasii]